MKILIKTNSLTTFHLVARIRRQADGKTDWENYDELKYCIFSLYGKLEKSTFRGINNPMCFKTQILRDDFMVVFKDLLEIAKPFL